MYDSTDSFAGLSPLKQVRRPSGGRPPRSCNDGEPVGVGAAGSPSCLGARASASPSFSSSPY